MPIVAEGLQAVAGGGFEIVAVCAAVSDLRNAIALTEPQLVLLDFTAEFAVGILGELESLLLSRRVVLLVYELSREMAFQAISQGVRGILRSTQDPETMLRCLERIHQGETWFENAVPEETLDTRRASLTGRETQLVRLLGMGLKNREIAETLAITEGTVKVYLSRLFQKLGVKDRFELALYGMKNPAAGAVRFPRAPQARRKERRLPQTIPPY